MELSMAKKTEVQDTGGQETSPATPAYQEQQGHEFTRKEYDTGLIFFWLLIIGIVFLAFCIIWTIADLIAPTGKTAFFVSLPFGVKFMVIGMFLFGFFMLFVMFTILYNRGTNAITKAIFSAEKLYREQKATKEARIITAGLLISIFVIGGGILLAIIQSAPRSGSGTGFLAFLAEVWSISFGEVFLLFSVLYLTFLTLIIIFAWLWNQGTIFFQKKFFLKNKEG
jgi:hypothetical protein